MQNNAYAYFQKWEIARGGIWIVDIHTVVKHELDFICITIYNGYIFWKLFYISCI